MTFKALMDLANFDKSSTPDVERFHSSPSSSSHWSSGGMKSKGNCCGAALSALALLAFLFLINAMQQSLDENFTSTTVEPIPSNFLLKDEQSSAPRDTDKNDEKSKEIVWNSNELKLDTFSEPANKNRPHV